MKWEELVVILHLDSLLLLKGGFRGYIFFCAILFIILYFIVTGATWLPFKGSYWESEGFQGRIYSMDLAAKGISYSSYISDSSNSFLGSKAISCESLKLTDFNTTPEAFSLQPNTALSCFIYIAASVSLMFIFLADIMFLCRTNSQLIVRQDSLRRLERVEEHASMPSLLTREPLWTFAFALNFLLIGITGVMYHSSLTLFTFRLDNYAWWALGATFSGYSIARFLSDGFPPDANICCLFGKIGIVCFLECEAKGKQRNSSMFTTMCLLSVLIFDLGMGYQLTLADSKPISVGVLLIIFFVFIFFLWLHWLLRANDISMRWTFIGFAFGCALIGVIGLQVDDVFCRPTSWFQGHILWHVATCACAYCVYIFLRSDAWVGLSDIKKVEMLAQQRNDSIAHESDHLGATPLQQPHPSPKGNRRVSDPSAGVTPIRVSQEPRISIRSANGQTPYNQLPRQVSNQSINQYTPIRPGLQHRTSNLSHNSHGSHNSGSQMLPNSQQRLHKSGPAAYNQRQSEKVYWVCTFCDFAMNELSWEHCDRCGQEREIA